MKTIVFGLAFVAFVVWGGLSLFDRADEKMRDISLAAQDSATQNQLYGMMPSGDYKTGDIPAIAPAAGE